MNLRFGAACKLFFQQALEKKASAEPSTQHDIEAFRLCASLFQAQLLIETIEC